MQNMKLLDLQEGKYLELGERGFFYGGDTITCPPIKSFIIKGTDRCFDIYADDIDMYDIRKLNNANTDNDVNSGSARIFEITFKSNNQKFVGVPVSNIDDRFNRLFYKTEPQEPLKTLCEKTGAVVYGGRYVLFISNERDSYNNWCGDLMISCEELFEEYSKQLRNEPNKFEELTELIK